MEQPDYSARFLTYQETVTGLSSVVDAGTALLAETDGKTLDSTSRDALVALVAELTETITPATEWLATYEGLADQAETDRIYPPFLPPYDGERAKELTGEIQTARDTLTADHEAWKVEQERLRLEREAAERAAAEAAARAEAQRVAAAQAQSVRSSQPARSNSGGTATAPAPASSGVAYSFRSLGNANQSVIDSCSGFGDTTNWLGVPSFSVHWDCGGSRIANLPAGSLVKIENGQYAGTWRMNGLAYRLNGNVHTTQDIRQTGGLQIQTCIGGTYSNLGYYTLSRVG